MYNLINKKGNIYILENNNLVEMYDTNTDIFSLESNIYIGKIENVLDGMRMAFVNIGQDKNGILPFSDLSKKYSDEEIKKILRPRKRNFSTSKT